MSESQLPESQQPAKEKKKRFVLPIDASDRFKLHHIYMPFLYGGGVFFATEKKFDLGEEVNIFLNLVDEANKILLEGKVVWMTPKHSEGGYSAGIGLQLAGENASEVRSKIENILAGSFSSGPYTQTM